MNDNFCPAPWISMYYHLNSAAVCCVSEDKFNMSPKQFLSSDYLQDIKNQFLRGERPDNCSICFKLKDQNQFNVRQSYLNSYPSIDLFQRKIKHIELRLSNLCNFKCRICFPDSSSEIEKEYAKYNSEEYNKSDFIDITNDNFNELKEYCLGLDQLWITGGEPMITKQCYDLLDYLIEHKANERISLILFTNCSVINPSMLRKLLKFPKLHLYLSIDGIKGVAEYQRHGTKWSVIEQNIRKYLTIPSIKITIRMALSAYTVLDISNFVKFIIDLSKINKELTASSIAVVSPEALNYLNLNIDLRNRAVKELSDAIDMLDNRFKMLKDELNTVRLNIIEQPIKDYELFKSYTNMMDNRRNESFESIFGYSLNKKDLINDK